MEYIGGGELKTYLRSLVENSEMHYEIQNEVLSNTLLRFCQEIADRMSYLSRKDFILYNVAARNILLTSDIKCVVRTQILCVIDDEHIQILHVDDTE
jgi:regulator of sigma D